MTETPKQTREKVDNQKIALDNYLSKLLEEIPENLELETKLFESEKKTSIPIKEANQSLVVQPSSSKSKIDQTLKSSHPISVMPEWSRQEFQALYFKVDELILATPLTDLLRTIKNEVEPTPLPGQPAWFLGILDEHGTKVGILDAGQLIFGKGKALTRDPSTHQFKHILITQDGRWGLACDEIISIAKLEPEHVRWRTFRKKRPWLIGTVIDELTAVIDINSLLPGNKFSNS